MEEKVNTKAKEEDLATMENSKRRGKGEKRVRMAPNMGAGGSHPQATSDPGEREMAEGNEEMEEILKLLRGWQEEETSPIVRWALAEESTEEESNQESGEEEKKETRGMRWADCEDDEGEKNKEEQETEEARQQEAGCKKEQEAERKQEQEQEQEERKNVEKKREQRRSKAKGNDG